MWARVPRRVLQLPPSVTIFRLTYIHPSTVTPCYRVLCILSFSSESDRKHNMAHEEPTLPPLQAVSWDEQRQSISNPRKRVRPSRLPAPTTSSDPAVFSSDDDPDVTNYVEGRHKKRYVGSWFQHNPASSDSAFSEDRPAMPAMKSKRTFERNFDSGVYLASDGVESDTFESIEIPTRDIIPRISEKERALRANIDACLESGDETIDFWGMDLDELSEHTMVPLAQFTRIPQITKDVEFVQEDPKLKLYLSQNQLSRLPGSLFNITHLTILSLRGNQLTEIPQAIYKLKNLQEVNLSQNRLQHLPVELLDLLNGDSNLRTLVIWPNPCFLPANDFPSLEAPNEENHQDFLDTRGLPQMSRLHEVGGSTAPHLISRRLGRSPVQVYGGTGNIISEFIFPTLDPESLRKERLEVDRQFKPIRVSRQGEPSELDNSEPSRLGNRAPSLVEAVMRQIQDSKYLPNLAGYIPDELPHLRSLLERCVRQKDAGGIACSQCRKAIVVPVAEWIEWREVGTVVRGKNGSLDTESQDYLHIAHLSQVEDETWVPFLHRACSWQCGPREHHAGWDIPTGRRGCTSGYRLIE